VECIPGFRGLGALTEPIVHLYSASLLWMGNLLGLAIGAHGARAVNFSLMLAIVLEEFGFRICPPADLDVVQLHAFPQTASASVARIYSAPWADGFRFRKRKS
jgi:hypothetical protein